MKRLVTILTLACAVLLAPALSAHDEKDPVCGMMVDVETAKWKTDHQGKTYYFCMEADLKTFTANPDKYVSVLRLTKVFGPRIMVVSVRPREPRGGEAAKFFLTITRTAPDGMSADESRTFPVRSAVAEVYLLDRTRSLSRRRIRFQPTKEKDVYGVAVYLPREGAYRLRVVAEPEVGPTLTAHFDFMTAEEAARQAQDHPDDPRQKQPEPPTPDEGLSMGDQHETMKVLGRRWTDVNKSLFSDDPDREALLEALAQMDRQQKNMPKFQLHKFPENKAEFDRYAGEFDGMLSEFRGTIERRDWIEARKGFIKIDGTSCTKCHLKFRWGVAEDLTRFPDLRRLEYGRED